MKYLLLTPDSRLYRPRDVLRNALLLTALWTAYSAVREVTISSTPDAFSNAATVMTVQEALGLDIEAGVQALLGFGWLFRLANVYYLVHFPVTVAALAATYALSRAGYFVRFRNALIGTTGVALLLHMRYPLAPPRMLDGYIDSGAIFGPNPYELAGSNGANQFAAMPSMHVGWAVLVGMLLWAISTNRLIRALAVFHPMMTAFVVVLTANHYVLDVLIGAALAFGAWYAINALQTAAHNVPAPRPQPAGILGPES